MIIIDPLGGLCNRMRAIDSCLALARQTKQRVALLWFRTNDFNCNFDTLFKVPKEIGWLIQLDAVHPFGIMRRRLIHAIIRRTMRVCLEPEDVGTFSNPKHDFLSLAQNSSFYIRTWERFYLERPPFEGFRASPSMQRLIDESNVVRENHPTVGVHIRRPENLDASEHSKFEAFLDCMKAECATDPDIRFFLATDEPEDQKKLAAIFGQRLLLHPKRALDRSKPEALEDALVDLWILSKCKRIIGSHGSSFSNTAAALGQIDLEIV